MSDKQPQDFVDAFDNLWDRYRKQWKAARREITEESIHDLRVSARRFLALLGILRELDTHPHVKTLRRFVKKQLDSLDQMHDTQVMLEEATQAVQKMPELRLFRAYLDGRCEELARQASERIHESKPSDLKKQVKKIRAVATRHSDDTKLLDHLQHAVDQAHAKTMERFGDLSAQDPSTIHHVRIAFKKLRYMIETIQPLLPGYPQDHLDRMHAYQDLMGTVHDTTVLLDTVREFARRLPAAPGPPAFDLQPVEGYYQQRLQQLIRAYFDRKDEFNGFWRAAPDRPFPWEQNNEAIHRTPRHRRAAPGHRHGAGRQPESPDQQGPQAVPAGREGPGGTGDRNGPDPDFPVPTGG